MANGNTPSGWVDMRERHSEKLLLAGLFLVLIFMAWATDATWPENMANMVLGALIGIITGRSQNSRMLDMGQRGQEVRGESVTTERITSMPIPPTLDETAKQLEEKQNEQ